MKLVKPWYTQLYDFFFQSEEEQLREQQLCREAQVKYYQLLGNIKPHKDKRPLRYR